MKFWEPELLLGITSEPGNPVAMDDSQLSTERLDLQG